MKNGAAKGKSSKPAPAAPSANAIPAPIRAIKDLTKVFKSLADEHRIRILYMLSRNPEMHVSAIGEELGQSQPAVSHHLMQLRNAGLIDFRRDGKFNFYALTSEGIMELLTAFFPEGGPTKIALGDVEIAIKTKK